MERSEKHLLFHNSSKKAYSYYLKRRLEKKNAVKQSPEAPIIYKTVFQGIFKLLKTQFVI
jgi:hypothetical protein